MLASATSTALTGDATALGPLDVVLIVVALVFFAWLLRQAVHALRSR